MVSATQDELLAGPGPATELHHRIPRRLLRAYDRACELAPIGEPWNDEGLQLWIEFEIEGAPYGIDSNATREELVALIEGSVIELPRKIHREEAHTPEERRKWGRRGEISTYRRYGRPWFAAPGRRRWGRISAEELEAIFPGGLHA